MSGRDSEGHLVGAAAKAHEEKMKREDGNKSGDHEPEEHHGRGYNKHGDLVGAAAHAHEEKMKREGGDNKSDDGQEEHHGRGYDKHGNLVGAAAHAHEEKTKREACFYDGYGSRYIIIDGNEEDSAGGGGAARRYVFNTPNDYGVGNDGGYKNNYDSGYYAYSDGYYGGKKAIDRDDRDTAYEYRGDEYSNHMDSDDFYTKDRGDEYGNPRYDNYNNRRLDEIHQEIEDTRAHLDRLERESLDYF